jgi:hypothetical protein
MEDLNAERTRLQNLIAQQKFLISRDIQDIREEVAEKLNPVVRTAGFVKTLTSPETRASSLFQIGSSVLLEVFVRRAFSKSNFLIQLVLPTIVKNYSSHLLFSLAKTLAQQRAVAKTRKRQQISY